MHHLTLSSQDPDEENSAIVSILQWRGGRIIEEAELSKVTQLVKGRVRLLIQVCTPHHHNAPRRLPPPSGNERPIQKALERLNHFTQTFQISPKYDPSDPSNNDTRFSHNPSKGET